MNTKRRKPTEDEIAKALNPDLTDATATLCGQTFKVPVLPLNKEQAFLKLLRRVLPQAVTGEALLNALLDADIVVLAQMAAIVTANAGADLSADDILEGGRMVDVVDTIRVQLEENGYLDFLLRLATAMPELLSAKQ